MNVGPLGSHEPATGPDRAARRPPRDFRTMKLTLRFTLTTTLVTLIGLTVAALGYNSHRNARFTAEDLSSQILDETSKQIESQLDTILKVASMHGHLNDDLLRDRQFDTETFARLARFWISVLKTNPRISRE